MKSKLDFYVTPVYIYKHFFGHNELYQEIRIEILSILHPKKEIQSQADIKMAEERNYVSRRVYSSD